MGRVSTETRPAPGRKSAAETIFGSRWALISPVSFFEILLVGLISAVLGAFAYWLSPTRPGVVSHLGAFGWWDQQEYLAELNTLLTGHLPANSAEYRYGLGYPLIGLPFKALGLFDTDPFIIPDLIMLAITMAATYVVAVRWINRVAGVAVVGLLLLSSPIIELAIVPWSSTVVLVSLAVALLIASTPGSLTTGRAIAFVVPAGGVFACR